MRRTPAAIVCGVLLALGCGRARPARPPAAPGPARGGELRLEEEPDIGSWDPLDAGDVVSQSLVSQVYDALVEYAPRPPYEPLPALARTWSVDGGRWTFRLRSEARFADDACFPSGRGRRVTAADVRYSFERELRSRRPGRFLSPTWALGGARDVYEGRADSLPGLQVAGDSAVVFDLVAPCAAFVHVVAAVAIVPHEAVERYGTDFWQHPVGAGPFRLVRWTPQESAVLARNDSYWQRDARGLQLPYLDRVVLYLVPPTALAGAAPLHVLHQRLGALAGGAASGPPGGHVLQRTRFNVIYLGWSFAHDSPWTRDVRLRRALSLAVHRPSGPEQVPARGLLPPGLAGFDSLRPALGPDPEAAARLLAAAGHPHGRGLPPIRLRCILEEQPMLSAALAPWRDLGVAVEVQPLTKAQYWQTVPHEEPAFFRWGWIADFPDAASFFELFYGPSGQNVGRFRDARFDSLFEAAAREPETALRAALYGRLEDLLLEHMPAVFLLHDRDALWVSDEVRDFDLCVNPLWKKRYKHVWLAAR